MGSPAENYDAARERAGVAQSETGRFAEGLGFALDDFQLKGCQAVEAGQGVLVAAPTGAGKTVVGEFAVHMALATGRKAFYTTPIKALSNQKYHDLVARHGSEKVGLLTGDSRINGEAPIVVMTTEVLRNMIYAGSTTLDGLGYVVMDEVHYLADRFRGAVWEEVIIHVPQSVQVISLSATVSNAEEFGDWLTHVRGNTEVIVSEHRPVPLWQHVMVGRELFDLFVDETSSPTHDTDTARVNPRLLDRVRSLSQRRGGGGWRREDAGAPRGRRGTPRGGHQDRGGKYGGGRRQRRRGQQGKPGYGGARSYKDGARGYEARGSVSGPDHRSGRGRWADDRAPAGGNRTASRAEVIDRLERDGLLPAITFIFSRAGCSAAVSQLLAWGTDLIGEAEGRRVRRIVEERCAGLEPSDLGVLGYHEFVDGLSRGFAAHHAGMLPLFREVVEELFTQGRIKAVFATETLALGINMPARTVVIEKLVKFNGESHTDLTPAEYTQLTGRAGRRGIDVEGHAVVLHRRGVDPQNVAGLASTRTYPLRSSFRPTYNMAVNLVAQVGRERAEQVLETSFAQFQADRSVVGLSSAVRRNEEALAGYAEAMECDKGDFAAYARLREDLNQAQKADARSRKGQRRIEIEDSVRSAKPGDVILLPEGRRSFPALVVRPPRKGPRSNPPGVITVITWGAHQRRVAEEDISSPLVTVGRVNVPKHVDLRSARSRKEAAQLLRDGGPYEEPQKPNKHEDADDERVRQLRRDLKAHPCHQCPDRENHARWGERWHRLNRETERLRGRMARRTNTVARTFSRICDVLAEIGYLQPDGDGLLDPGEGLRRLYSEKDLLTSECLRHGHWDRLDAPSLAAVVSCLVHEPRREETSLAHRMPNDDVDEAYRRMLATWGGLQDVEARHQLPLTGEPDAGIAWVVHRWASGRSLEIVLRDSDMTAGDFVRRCKQLVDLLGQVATAAPNEHVRRTAHKAADAVMRGVVAADRLD